MKNVHDLLAKLAWDFSPEQLDHLFDCFKVSRRCPGPVLLTVGPIFIPFMVQCYLFGIFFLKC